MERPSLAETLQVPINVARFIGSRLLGGGWSELPDLIGQTPASITYLPERPEPEPTEPDSKALAA